MTCNQMTTISKTMAIGNNNNSDRRMHTSRAFVETHKNRLIQRNSIGIAFFAVTLNGTRSRAHNLKSFFFFWKNKHEKLYRKQNDTPRAKEMSVQLRKTSLKRRKPVFVQFYLSPHIVSPACVHSFVRHIHFACAICTQYKGVFAIAFNWFWVLFARLSVSFHSFWTALKIKQNKCRLHLWKIFMITLFVCWFLWFVESAIMLF